LNTIENIRAVGKGEEEELDNYQVIHESKCFRNKIN